MFENFQISKQLNHSNSDRKGMPQLFKLFKSIEKKYNGL